jgi:hypothetical protein
MDRISMDMTPELQRYYEDRLGMFADPAWRELMVDVQNMLDATNTLSGVDDEKTLQFRKGEISIMRWMLSLEEVTADSYEQLKGEKE